MAAIEAGGVGQAMAALDGLARYCAFTCGAAPDECAERSCEVGDLKSAAAERVAARWFDQQD